MKLDEFMYYKGETSLYHALGRFCFSRTDSVYHDYLYPDNYDFASFTKVWDSRMLIKSMVELIALNRLTGETYHLDILAQRWRVFSVLSACYRLIFCIANNMKK